MAGRVKRGGGGKGGAQRQAGSHLALECSPTACSDASSAVALLEAAQPGEETDTVTWLPILRAGASVLQAAEADSVGQRQASKPALLQAGLDALAVACAGLHPGGAAKGGGSGRKGAAAANRGPKADGGDSASKAPGFDAAVALAVDLVVVARGRIRRASGCLLTHLERYCKGDSLNDGVARRAAALISLAQAGKSASLAVSGVVGVTALMELSGQGIGMRAVAACLPSWISLLVRSTGTLLDAPAPELVAGQAALKGVVVTLQRMREETLRAARCDSSVAASMKALGHTATTLLAQDTTPRDWTMHAGVVIAALTLAVGPAETGDAAASLPPHMLGALFAWRGAAKAAPGGPHIRLQHSQDWLPSHEFVGRPCAVVALCRGALGTMSRASLLQAYTDPTGSQTCLLLDVLLPLLTEQCQGSVSQSLLHVALGGVQDGLAAWGAAVKKGAVDLNEGPLRGAWLRLLERLTAVVFSAGEDRGEKIRAMAKSALDTLVQIESRREAGPRGGTEASSGVEAIALRLLEMDWRVKGRYSLLSALVRSFGAKRTLELCPGLPKQLMSCLHVSDLVVNASDVYATLCKALCREVAGSGGKAAAADGGRLPAAWTKHLLPVVVEALEAPKPAPEWVGKHWLPATFKCFPGALAVIADTLSTPPDRPASSRGDPARRLQAYLTVLAAGRKAGLMDGRCILGDGAAPPECSVPTSVAVHYRVLSSALVDVDEAVRTTAMEFLCGNVQTTAEIESAEVQLFEEFLPVNMNVATTKMRQALAAAVKSFLARARDSYIAIFKHNGALDRQYAKLVEKDGPIPEEHEAAMDAAFVDLERREGTLCKVAAFVLDVAVASIMPGGSFLRWSTAVSLLDALFTVFRGGAIDDAMMPEDFPDLRSPLVADTLVSVVVHSTHPVVREPAARLLRAHIGAPLPSFAEPTRRAEELLSLGLRLACSTRPLTYTRGVHVCTLAFGTYVVDAGWVFRLARGAGQGAVCASRHSDLEAPGGVEGTAGGCIAFAEDLVSVVLEHIELAGSDALQAATSAPVHGLLSLLREVMLLTPRSGIEAELTRWAALVSTVVTRVLPRLKQRLLGLLGARTDSDCPDFADLGTAMDETVASGGREGPASPPDGQLQAYLLAFSWHGLKAVAALPSTLAHVFLETRVGQPASKGSPVLADEAIESMAALLQDLLIRCRHRGVVEAAGAGLQALCEELQTAQARSDLQTLPTLWLERHLAGMEAMSSQPGQSVTRRGAGLPHIFQAILASQPSDAAASSCISRLASMAAPRDVCDQDETLDNPQAMAMHLLRPLFCDTSLANVTLLPAARCAQYAIDGFGSDDWAVRNAALLLFTSVLQRLVGSKLVRDDLSSLNSCSAADMAARHQGLWAFLEKTLELAVDAPHELFPQLFPVLTLLARLRPDMPVDARWLRLLGRIGALLSSPVMTMRSLAARTLAALHPSPAGLLRETCEDLCAAAGTLASNTVHGYLLLVRALWRSGSVGRDAASWAERLAGMQWLGQRDTCRSAALRGLYFALLRDCLFAPPCPPGGAEEATPTAGTMAALAELAGREILPVEATLDAVSSASSAMWSDRCLEAAAACVLHRRVFGLDGADEGAAVVLETLLCSRHPSVVEVALQGIVGKTWRHDEGLIEVALRLLLAACARADAGQHQLAKCMDALVAVGTAYDWARYPSSASDPGTFPAAVAVVADGCSQRHTVLAESSMTLAGLLVRVTTVQAWAAETTLAGVTDRLQAAWRQAIAQIGAEDAPASRQLAGLRGLELSMTPRSGPTAQHRSPHLPFSLRLVRVQQLIACLESEDQDVRVLAAEVTCALSGSQGPPRQPAVALAVAFRILAKMANEDLSASFEALTNMLSIRGLAAANTDDLFTKESDNAYAEPVVRAQHAFNALVTLIGGGMPNDNMDRCTEAHISRVRDMGEDVLAWLDNRSLELGRAACADLLASLAAAPARGDEASGGAVDAMPWDECLFQYGRLLLLAACVYAQLVVARARGAVWEWSDSPVLQRFGRLALVINGMEQRNAAGGLPPLVEQALFTVFRAAFVGHPPGPSVLVRRYALLSAAAAISLARITDEEPGTLPAWMAAEAVPSARAADAVSELLDAAEAEVEAEAGAGADGEEAAGWLDMWSERPELGNGFVSGMRATFTVHSSFA